MLPIPGLAALGQPPLGWHTASFCQSGRCSSGRLIPTVSPGGTWGWEGMGRGRTHLPLGRAQARTGCLTHSRTSLPRSAGRQVQGGPITLRAVGGGVLEGGRSHAAPGAGPWASAYTLNPTPPPTTLCCSDLWAEALHLVFRDDHLGDDDEDRGALGRRRERENATVPV